MTEPDAIPENDQTHVTNLSQVDVEAVQAGLARMHQSSAREIRAESLELNFSLAMDVEAVDLTARDTLVGLAQAVTMSMQDGVAGAVRAEEMSLGGAAGVVVAGTVEFNNSYAGFVAGREIRGGKIESIVLLSRKVEGDVNTVLDARGALIVGLAGGLFAGMMLLLGRMLFGRK